MTLQNPNVKYLKSSGVDLPIMVCYLAGRICGEHIKKCLKWRQDIINHYKNYKNRGVYPISFLDPLNSKEGESIDRKGLTSNIPPNFIYDKDLLSVEKADILVANMEDFFEEDIKKELSINKYINMKGKEYFSNNGNDIINPNFENLFFKLQNKILNRRENLGTVMEVAWALYLKKPVILIVSKRRREIFENHPFTRRASVIVYSVRELLEKKWLNLFYKSISGAIY